MGRLWTTSDGWTWLVPDSVLLYSKQSSRANGDLEQVMFEFKGQIAIITMSKRTEYVEFELWTVRLELYLCNNSCV